MAEHQSSRTLVKSAPELWAECSDASSLARHLGAVGEIRITRLEPETTVAWEGAAASGTVNLEPSGWGTRVTLTLVQDEGAAPLAATPEPELEPDPEPDPAPSEAEMQAQTPDIVVAAPRPGVLGRFRLRWRRQSPEPTAVAEGTADPAAAEVDTAAEVETAAVQTATEKTAVQTATETAAVDPASAPAPVAAGDDALAAALDSLGRAHHRPYSRS